LVEKEDRAVRRSVRDTVLAVEESMVGCWVCWLLGVLGVLAVLAVGCFGVLVVVVVLPMKQSVVGDG